MSQHEFSHGTKFLLNGLEVVVKRSGHRQITVENVKYGNLETYKVVELLRAWVDGNLEFQIDENRPIIETDFEAFSAEKKNEAERRYKLLLPFINREKKFVDLAEHLEEHNISQGTFYNWMQKWLRYRDIRYLISNFELRGPRKRLSDTTVLGMAEKVVDDMAYEEIKPSVQEMYLELKVRVNEANDFRENNQKLKCISSVTFWRVYRDVQDKYKQDVIRHGLQNAKLLRKGSRGRLSSDRILERVEIDWTQVDELLVNPVTLSRQRPWLVYAIDVHSGEPLGFHTCFNQPDTAAIKQCLLHCFLPKTYLSQLYPLVQKEWTAYGIPREVVLDNAKVNESFDLRDVCQTYGIDIQYCSIGSGHQKGTIERAFRTLNQKLFHRSPGTTFSNPFEKSQYDSEGEACITLQAFNYLVHIALVDMISHDWRHSITRAGIPHELWHKSLEANPHLRLSIPRNLKELKIVMGAGLEFRKLQAQGIKLEGFYFQSAALQDLRYEMDRLNRDDELRVRFDKDDLRVIYIRDPINENYIEAYPDIEILADRKIRSDLPIPFYEVQLRSVELSRAKLRNDDLHVGLARRNVEVITEQQQCDQKQGYVDTLNEMEQQTQKFEDMGYELDRLNLPEDISDINSVQVAEALKQADAKSRKKKSHDAVHDQSEHQPGLVADIELDDDLPTYQTGIKGA
ncbi:Mu transposase C-terminal domain-containing protein [Paenibacillus sp. BC26]|uniref:Mu transposase C-terminal domain-containing protein n=1 Tax=Paenibacillus sp. BC26 TaxID=1881032 RepID=UPI0008F3E8FB|nr:Mu transposase C-terminal domain-containing protein [Paenibacillus sp. BC26]SFT05839.1 putative transposase [Paenibacillus sp. BC26]